MQQPINHYGEAAGIKAAFAQLSSRQSYSRFVQAISTELATHGYLDKSALQGVQQANNVANLTDYREELLDVVLDYVRLVLDDHVLTDAEADVARYLKRLFSIKEGDFYRFRHPQVKEVLHLQFERIYQDDDKISPEEAMHKVALQDVFDLSYDQFLEFKEQEIRMALARGADIRDLDTAKIPKT